MKIKELTLFTRKLKEQFHFYCEVFRCELLSRDEASFTIKVGHTKLTFTKSDKEHIYHYCFLLPANKIHESIAWLQEKVDIITYENGRVIEPGPDNWNSESVYFLDPAGNVAEFIVRHDLKNESPLSGFNHNQILSVNEIGMPSKNTAELNQILETKLNSPLWYGNLTRFGANGTQDGLFLLVNYEEKKTWFPTELFPAPTLFHGVFEVDGASYDLAFENEQIKVDRQHGDQQR